MSNLNEHARFIMTDAGDCYRRWPDFVPNDYKGWRLVSDFEALAFFKAAGADLVALGLDHLDTADAPQRKRKTKPVPEPLVPDADFDNLDMIGGENE